MAAAQPGVLLSRLKMTEPLASMIEGIKFLKWNETNSSGEKNYSLPVGVTLKSDEKCLILYWRDLNKKSDYLDISLIRDVRTGKYANVPKDKNMREVLASGKSNISIQDKTISIYYGQDYFNLQIINFVSMSENPVETAREWTEFLFKCSINQRMLNLSPWESLMKLRSCLLFGKAVIDEKSRDFRLPVQTLIDAFIANGKQSVESERLNVSHALQSVGLPSGKNDMLDEKTLTCQKFYELFLHLVSKEDIEQIFHKYANKRKLCLSAEQFEDFLNKQQRDPGLNELLYPFCTTDKAAEMIQKYEIDDNFKKKNLLSPQGLMRYLMDFENEVVDPVKYELHQDMEQPLSHYYINSSHNTYLTGHQITGKSDAEMYRQVLLAGCRCIELDCHDDDSLDEPVITHGHTLCTKILFSEAIHAINESAFKTSPYPVILSFENYCSKRMQEKMAKYLIDILGSQLLTEPLPSHPIEPEVVLPSPEELKYKILIKFRKKSAQSNSTTTTTTTTTSTNMTTTSILENETNSNETKLTTIVKEIDENSSVAESSATGGENSTNKVTSQKSQASTLERANSAQSNSDSSDSEKEDSNDKEAKSANVNLERDPTQPTTCMDISTMVNYIQPVTFRSFEASRRKHRSYEMSSFVETTAINLLKDKAMDFVNYNKRQLSRIYPKGTRISSDNFIPQIFWNVGCQMTALNFQTLDLGMQLNQGKFEYNNRCGYLLKPEIMRQDYVNKLFDPFTETPVDGIVASRIQIRIISGIFLNCTKPDSERRVGQTVTVELYGLPADSIRGAKCHRVKAATSNTFNVIYSDPKGFTFKKIIMPQLGLIKITAYDDQNKIVGGRVLPTLGLRPGHRYICLKNESNQPNMMTLLFVNIQVQDYVPEEHEEIVSALVNPISYQSSRAEREELIQVDENKNNNLVYNLYDAGDLPGDNPRESITKLGSNFNLSQLLSPDRRDSANANLESCIMAKRNSWINVKSIKMFNTMYSGNSNCAAEPKSPTGTPGPKDNSLFASNLNKLQSTSNSNLLKPLDANTYSASRSNRFSLTIDKFNQSLMPRMDHNNICETKRKSQSDLMNLRGLSSSIYNMTRSCSLNCNELDAIDHKKNMFDNSKLNDPDLFTEIQLEELKLQKSYLQLVKTFKKKAERIEKEADKKVNELEQHLDDEMDKIRNNYVKIKTKLDKNRKKQVKKLGLKTSKSTSNIDTSAIPVDSDLSYQKQLKAIDDEFYSAMDKSIEKYFRQMVEVYEEAYKNVKNVKVSSIEPLYARLEKLVQDESENRKQQLKNISDKEMSSVFKQANELIKAKKNILLHNVQDKEEFAKLSKQCEKELVILAANEKSKLLELLKAKEKLLNQKIANSINILKESKEKEPMNHENDYYAKIKEKKFEVKKRYLYKKSKANEMKLAVTGFNIEIDSQNSNGSTSNSLNNMTINTYTANNATGVKSSPVNCDFIAGTAQMTRNIEIVKKSALTDANRLDEDEDEDDEQVTHL